jgi:DHA1 family bicyclomycin/chloramphenicol resistance-like MFS transporter
MPLILSIVLAVFLAEAEIDISVPSFPEIRAFFGTSVFQTEWILTANLIAHCVAALIVGVLGDRYGKKRILLYGLSLFILGSIIIVTTSEFSWLLFGRVLQGSGVAAPMVLGYVLAIEGTSKQLQQSRMGILNGVANISLALTPSIGSYVTLYYGWRGNFQLLLILGMLSYVICYICIPKDTLQPNKKQHQHLIRSYTRLLFNKKILLYIFATSLFPAGWFVFVGLAPMVYLESMGVKLAHYGIYQGMIALCFGLFSLYSGKFIKIFGKKNAMKYSFILLFLSVFFLILTLFIPQMNSATIITLIMLIASIGAVIPVNTTHVMSIELKPEDSSKISALITMMRWSIASIGIQISALFYANNFTSTAMTMIVIDLLGFLCIAYMYRFSASFKKDLLN